MTAPDDRLSRREAEHLLDAPAEHDSALGWALTAASAPAHSGELRREDAAVAAFHAARVTAPPSGAARTTHSRRAASRAVVATGAVVALVSGGFALANVADIPLLPGPASDRASESVGRTPASSSDSSTSGGTTTGRSSGVPGSSGTRGPRSTSSTTGSQSPTSGSPSTSPTPRASFEGLCKAYQANDRDNGRSLDSSAFTALAAEAGGADRIAAYCVALVGPPKTDKPSPTKPPKPTKPARPTKPAKPTKPPKPTATASASPSPSVSPTKTPHANQPTDPGSNGNGAGGNSSTTSNGATSNGNPDKGGKNS